MSLRQHLNLRPALLLLRAQTFFILLAMCACAAVLLASLQPRGAESVGHVHEGAASVEDEVDADLERAAREALGSKDGTIILMDARSGRLRAVVNAQTAFNEAYAPGSAIKPFTALAALRLRLVDDRTRQLCRRRYTYKDLAISCSHQQTDAPFNLTQALAYSCNYFFGKVGERLDTASFDETLSSFGFGEPTGVNSSVGEATGTLPQGEWRASNALGDSTQLRVTPVQLITAYAALINGGHLLIPQRAHERGFQREERARLTIAPEHRAALMEGMRGAVTYGTAAGAGLGQLPFEVFGKTGTATMTGDYRTQGWFIGFADEQGQAASATPASIPLVVLVFIKNSSGAEAARAARPLFEEYAKRRVDLEKERLSEATRSRTEARATLSGVSVRVHLTGQNITKNVSLEEYVLGVVTAEGSMEDELEALKALAVASRTFALKNLQRHAQEGYDFCDSTHCQRYRFTIPDERRHARFRNLLRRAVFETAGETLRDAEGQVADAYFHADCGGMTADMETLWGAKGPGYLRGVTDESCAVSAHHAWVNVIPAEKLARALQSDAHSDVGARLESITINSLDRTGRVEFLTLEGERGRVLLRGWDFKIILGRALGWNILKSSRFDVTHVGPNFVFRGKGFGHGLGLCQEGAHSLARRGASYRQILAHYFPGTSLGSNGS